MIVNIGRHGGPIVWDGVYFFSPSGYPAVSDWELRKLIMFRAYEAAHGRQTEPVCEDAGVLEFVNSALENPALYMNARRPRFITECTACRHGGCLTDYLCHTTDTAGAAGIFTSGEIMSAVRVRGMTGAELAREPRNAANDPPDIFDYVMFTWGNCIAGDRLVMERTINENVNGGEYRFPDEHDENAGFKPGVRFYFRTEAIENHAGYVDDGYHPARIKDGVGLDEYLHCCVIPNGLKAELDGVIPDRLAGRVVYVENDCEGIWDWAVKVYAEVSGDY